MFINPLNMLEHDILILALLDASGNDINVDVMYRMNGSGSGPYDVPFITDVGVNGGNWQSSEPGDGSGNLGALLNDTSEALVNTWKFYKIGYLRGTLGLIEIRSNDGANTGTLSAAFMRLV